MKLKYLIEKLIDKDVNYYNIDFDVKQKIDIHKNPYSAELNELIKEAKNRLRAVKTIDGNIYTVGNQFENNILHEDIIKILAKQGYISNKYVNDWWLINDSINEFLCIERKRNNWHISESYETTKGLEIKKIKEKYKNVVVKFNE
jgi:hypothetical protein